MHRLFLALVALFLASIAWPANATTCFWVGGTGTFDTSTTTHWASSTGGSASSCAATGGVPKNAADTATFDGSSGGGTVTVNTNLSITTLNCGAFTGTIDWSANNNNLTLTGGWNCSGTGTRTINMGNGTWTINPSGSGTPFNNGTTTGLTWNANSNTLNLTGTNSGQSTTFAGGNLTYGTVNFAPAGVQRQWVISGANTFANIGFTAPQTIIFPSGTTQTVTNGLSWNASSSTVTFIQSSSITSNATIALNNATNVGSWLSLYNMNFTTNTPTFTSSFGINCSGATITSPTGGGGGGIIGGI